MREYLPEVLQRAVGCSLQRRDRSLSARAEDRSRQLASGATTSHPAIEIEGDVTEGSGNCHRAVGHGAEGSNPPRAEEPPEDTLSSARGSVITTPDLIDALATNLAPVRRLRPPAIRAFGWLLLAALMLALLVVSQGIRPDLAQRLREPTFILGMAGTLLTGILAAVAAFMLSLPDRSRFCLLLPAPALVLWLSTIGYQCLTNWVSLEPNGIHLGETAQCFATLVLTSLPLSLAMLVMLRYAAPLRPIAVTLTGSLAVAAITATTLSLFHDLDATVMILTWNLGTAALFVGLGAALGGKMFSWAAPISMRGGD